MNLLSAILLGWAIVIVAAIIVVFSDEWLRWRK